MIKMEESLQKLEIQNKENFEKIETNSKQ